MYYIYIIKSLKDNRFYTGFTNDLERRLFEHNRGSKSTKSVVGRGPFKLIYFEKTKKREEAKKREKFLKSGQGRKWRKEQIENKQN